MDNYSEYVKIFKTAKLYDKDKKIAGSVSNDLIIKLDEVFAKNPQKINIIINQLVLS